MEDRPQHLADISAGAVPGRHRVIHAAVRRVIGHEARAQLLGDVVHRRVLAREQLEQPQPLVHAVARREPHPQDGLLTIVVGPIVEDEAAALLGSLEAPPRENAGHVDDVLLRIAAVHAEGVELQQLPGVVLVDSFGHALQGAPAQRVGAHGTHRIQEEPAPGRRAELGPSLEPRELRRYGTGRHAFGVVQIEEHRRALRRGDEQVLELAERVRPDCFLDVGRGEEAVGALPEEDVEVVGPEVHHHFLELALRQRGPHDGELLELAREPPRAQRFGCLVGGVGRRTRHAVRAQALLASALCFEVEPGQVVPAQAEKGELPLTLGEHGVVDVAGVELLIDPVHHPDPHDAIDLAGARAVGEAVQDVVGGIAPREDLGGQAAGRSGGHSDRGKKRSADRPTARPPDRRC